MKTIEEIRAALYRIHDYATGKSTRAYMEIPANPERDADLIVSAAIDAKRSARTSAAFLEAGAAIPEIAAKMRTQPLAVWLKVAANTIAGLEAEHVALVAARNEALTWRDSARAEAGVLRRERDAVRVKIEEIQRAAERMRDSRDAAEGMTTGLRAELDEAWARADELATTVEALREKLRGYKLA